MFRNIIFITVLYLLLSGCSALELRSNTRLVNDNDNNYIADYIVGEEYTASVGDAFVRSTSFFIDEPNVIMVKSYSPQKSFTIELPYGPLKFNKDKIYYSIYSEGGLNLIQKKLTDINGKDRWLVCIQVNSNGEVVGDRAFYLAIDLRGKAIKVEEFYNYRRFVKEHRNFVFNNKSLDFPKFNSLGDVRIRDYKGIEKGLTKELVYSGKTKNTINVLYREYTSDSLIRSGYTHPLTYDLDESDVIKFKNVLIKILSSSNRQLTFKVLSQGDPFE